MKRLFYVIPLVVVLSFAFGCRQGEEVAEEPAVDISLAEIYAIQQIGQVC